MIAGNLSPVGYSPVSLATDNQHLVALDIAEEARLAKLTLYCAGGGSAGAGTATVRGVIYREDGVLLGYGDEISVPWTATEGWVDLTFLRSPALILPAGRVYASFHVGGATNAARVWFGAPSVPPAVAQVRNLVTNPSFEVNTTGWVAYPDAFVTISRVAGGPGGNTGSFVARASRASGVGHAGIQQSVASLTPGTKALSGWVKGVAGAPGVIYADWSTPGAGYGWSSNDFTFTGVWQYVSEAYTLPVGATFNNIYVWRSNAPIGENLDVAGVIDTLGSAFLDYFDGDSPGYRWEGTAHASPSTPSVMSSPSSPDTYADGPANPLGATTPQVNASALYATFSSPWSPPAADDDYLASMDFHSAQTTYKLEATVPSTTVNATCEWHGSRLDEETGSFAIVRSDGPLADLVGERIEVLYENRAVRVYVHTATAAITSDLSLTRRAFAALALLSTEELTVQAQILGES